MKVEGVYSIVLQEVDEFVKKVNYPLGRNFLVLVLATLVKRMHF